MDAAGVAHLHRHGPKSCVVVGAVADIVVVVVAWETLQLGIPSAQVQRQKWELQWQQEEG